jgi:hypothetical protein
MWIRVAVVGVIGLAGMGAVAALGRDPAPGLPLAEPYPVLESKSKSDRLPLNTEHDTAENTVQSTPVAASPTVPAPAPAQADLVAPPSQPKPDPAPSIVSRPLHDPADSKFKSRKRARISKRSQIVRQEQPKQATEATTCSESGLDTFLRSVNLKPRCQ